MTVANTKKKRAADKKAMNMNKKAIDKKAGGKKAVDIKAADKKAVDTKATALKTGKTADKKSSKESGENQEKDSNTKRYSERNKNGTLLLIGIVLLAASGICTLITHREFVEGIERPYAYSLTFLFVSVMLTVRGMYLAVVGTGHTKKTDIRRLTQAGLLAALCYIGFAFFKIDIPIPGGVGKTAFHFGNVFCVLAALLLGGYWGGLAGAVGMTVGDLTTAYATSAPKTFLLKLCIGLIVGLVAHGIFKISRAHTAKYVTGVTILASACGMGFNIVADPLVGYFYKMYLLGIPQDIAATLAKMSAITTFVNAIVAVIAASIFYIALRPALKKSGLFIQLAEEKPLV